VAKNLDSDIRAAEELFTTVGELDLHIGQFVEFLAQSILNFKDAAVALLSLLEADGYISFGGILRGEEGHDPLALTEVGINVVGLRDLFLQNLAQLLHALVHGLEAGAWRTIYRDREKAVVRLGNKVSPSCEHPNHCEDKGEKGCR